MVRLPKNLSNTLTFKSDGIKTGANVLETELLGEAAYSLGLAAQSMEKSLAALKSFSGTQTQRNRVLQQAAETVYAYFVQRELMGFNNHDHPVEFYAIPKTVLSKIGSHISRGNFDER